MGFLTRFVVVVGLLLSFAPAQCPNLGCKTVPASEFVSSVLNSCGTGITFTVPIPGGGHVTYEPKDGKCPAYIEYCPTHTECGIEREGSKCAEGDPYDIRKIDYGCVGCGFLGLASCCESIRETVTNTLYNCSEKDC